MLSRVPAIALVAGATTLAACEPVVLGVGPVRVEEPNDAGLASSEPSESGEPPQVATVSDASVAVEPDAKCVRIGHFVDFDVWGLIVQTPAELSCEYGFDGGMPVYGAGVISRKDGSPMLRAATPYSLRWDNAGLYGLAVYGGASACDIGMIFEERPSLAHVGWLGIPGTLPASGCRDIEPSESVASVQVDGIVPSMSVELCEQACPAP